MCGTVMRGADALPGSKATSRAQGSQRSRWSEGRGQGEYAPAKHVLDSEPGSRVTGAGAYTATCAVTHPRQEKLWGGRRRLWHLHRPYEPMEVAPWSKSMISAEA